MIYVLLIIIIILLVIKENKNNFYLRSFWYKIEPKEEIIKNDLDNLYLPLADGDMINIEYYIPPTIKYNKVILFVPGYASKIEFEPLFSLMSLYKKKGYIIYVKNWRGIKSHIKYDNEKYFSESSINDFKIVLEYINNKHHLPIVSIGHSMGGILLMKYNHLYKNNINKIVLISTPLKLNKNYQKFNKTYIDGIFRKGYINNVKKMNKNNKINKKLKNNDMISLITHNTVINREDLFFKWGTLDKDIFDNLDKEVLWITSKNDIISYYDGIEKEIHTDNTYFKKLIFRVGEHGNYMNSYTGDNYKLFNKINYFINS